MVKMSDSGEAITGTGALALVVLLYINTVYAGKWWLVKTQNSACWFPLLSIFYEGIYGGMKNSFYVRY